MSFRAASIKITNDVPKVDSVSYGNQINVKANFNQDYKVKTVGFGGGTSTGTSYLSRLKDVSVENAQQDDALLYNEENAKWENKKVNLDFGEY